MLTEIREKEPADQFALGLDYSPTFKGLEAVDGCVILITDLTDSSDQTSTMCANTDAEADVIEGTATAGSATELTDSTKDFAAEGVEVGMWFLNSTKGWKAKVRAIKTTTSPFDTLVFDEVPSAVAASDVYAFAVVKARVQAGDHLHDYEVKFTTTTTLGRVFEDAIPLQVRDNVPVQS